MQFGYRTSIFAHFHLTQLGGREQWFGTYMLPVVYLALKIFICFDCIGFYHFPLDKFCQSGRRCRHIVQNVFHCYQQFGLAFATNIPFRLIFLSYFVGLTWKAEEAFKRMRFHSAWQNALKSNRLLNEILVLLMQSRYWMHQVGVEGRKHKIVW